MARELKYSTPHTDFEALQRELSGKSTDDGDRNDVSDQDDGDRDIDDVDDYYSR